MVSFVSPAIVQVQTVKYRVKLVSLCVKLLWRLTRYGEISIFFESEVTNENEQYFFQYVVLTKTYQPSLQGNFDKAVEILKPLRYKINLLGGSRAQVRKCWLFFSLKILFMDLCLEWKCAVLGGLRHLLSSLSWFPSTVNGVNDLLADNVFFSVA